MAKVAKALGPCPECGERDCGGAPRFKGLCSEGKIAMREAEALRTFPSNPTWEQKCRKAWEENARLEAQRLAAAQQIVEMNGRLGINDTNARRIEDMKDIAVRAAEITREMGRKDGEIIGALRAEIAALKQLLADAEAAKVPVDTAEPELVADLEEHDEPGDDAVEDALTEAVRAVKAVRREWRER